LGELDKDLYDSWLEDQSCFVLVDNVPKTRLSAKGALKNYKKQWKVEDVFHFIKQPLDFGPLWLDTPKRIESLLFLISLAVLAASFLLFRLHETLSGSPCGQDEPKLVPKKFVDVTGRKVSKPTFNMVREHLVKLKVVVYIDPDTGNWIRKFQKQTRRKWLQIIVDIGFDPKIYLEPYSSAFDLWCYRPT
jgi:transposase